MGTDFGRPRQCGRIIGTALGLVRCDYNGGFCWDCRRAYDEWLASPGGINYVLHMLQERVAVIAAREGYDQESLDQKVAVLCEQLGELVEVLLPSLNPTDEAHGFAMDLLELGQRAQTYRRHTGKASAANPEDTDLSSVVSILMSIASKAGISVGSRWLIGRYRDAKLLRRQ